MQKARSAGFASVTVACEPTGHRWRVLDELAARRGLALVCVQPLLVWRAREGEDLTWDRSDPKDAVIIARLAAGLRCYVPERTTESWARLRHLCARRVQLTTEATAGVQQLRDLLECVWPAALSASGRRFGRCRGVQRWPSRSTVPLRICAGCVGSAGPGSPPRYAASCPAGARGGRACGSSTPCSTRWPTRSV